MENFIFEIRGFASGIDLGWEDNSGWFGHIILKQDANGDIILDSEHLKKETVKKMFDDLIDQAIMSDWDEKL